MQAGLERKLRDRHSQIRAYAAVPSRVGFGLPALLALNAWLIDRRELITLIFLFFVPGWLISVLRYRWRKRIAVEYRSAIKEYIEHSNVLVDIADFQPELENGRSVEGAIIQRLLKRGELPFPISSLSAYCKTWFKRLSDSGESAILELTVQQRRFFNWIRTVILMTAIAFLSTVPLFGLPWSVDSLLLLVVSPILIWQMSSAYNLARNELNFVFEEEVIEYLLRELDFGAAN